MDCAPSDVKTGNLIDKQESSSLVLHHNSVTDKGVVIIMSCIVSTGNFNNMIFSHVQYCIRSL